MAELDQPQPDQQDEDIAPFSQQLNEEYQQKQAEATMQHFGDKIREQYKIPDASNSEALQVFHQMNIPDADQNETWQVLHQMYGQDLKLPQPPFPKKVLATVSNIGQQLINDVSSMPKAAFGIGSSIAELQNAEATGNTADYEATKAETLKNMQRGGAFALATAAAIASEGLTASFLPEEVAGTPWLGKAFRGALKGAAAGATGMGVYQAERMPPTADERDVLNAFWDGARGGAMFGAGLGAGGSIAGSVLDFYKHPELRRAAAAGKATAEATNSKQARIAAIKTATVFRPEWAPAGMDAETFSKQFIAELHGQDVADSETGQKAAAVIQKKIEKYNTGIVNNLNLEGPSTPPEIPQGEATNEILNAIPTQELGKEEIDLGFNKPAQDMTQQEMLDAIPNATPEEKANIHNELMDRGVGFNPTEEGIPNEKNADWVKAIKQTIQYAKDNPDDIAAQDKAARAKSNLDAYVARQKSNNSLQSEMATGEGGKVYGGFDSSLFRKLASKMYQGNLGRIVPKELLQNAIDSVRGNPNGAIKIEAETYNPENRGIKILDNGSGMTPDIVQRELVDLGSSVKPEGASGGFGLAKAALFTNAEHIHVETIADVQTPSGPKRVMTTLKGSGEDWINPKKGLDFESHNVNPNLPTGTKIELRFPEKDPDGNRVSWDSHDINGFLKDAVRYNRTGIPIDFTVNGNRYTTPPMDMTKPAITLNTSGGKIHIFTSGPVEQSPYREVKILNNGIPQFGQGIPFLNNAPYLPREIVADVVPDVKPDNSAYPFTTNREQLTTDVRNQLNDYVMKDLAKIGSDAAREKYKRVLEGSPKIGPYSVIDPTETRNPLIAEDIVNTPEYEPHIRAMDMVMTHIADVLGGEEYHNAMFDGFTTNSEQLGVNIKGPLTTGRPENYIFINPWKTFEESIIRSENDLIPKTITGVIHDYVSQVVSTLIHELEHQYVSEHNERFAGRLTRSYGIYGSEMQSAIDIMMNSIKNPAEMFKILSDHLRHLNKDDQTNTGSDIFKTISSSSTGQR